MNFRTIIIIVALSLILLILLIIFDPLNVNLKSNGLENTPNVVFTKTSIKEYDGIDGNKAYIAVNGIVYDVTDINLAREAKNRLIHDYIDQPKYSKACASLDDGFEDAFQYTVQGNSHNRLKSTNLIERLNQEVRRREKIIRIFPNQTSANRLIGAVLMDLHDEWIYSSRKYINFDK